MRVFDLPCMNGRKSFYGKAKVIELDNGTKQLLSYNTIVCEIDSNRNFKKIWTGSSHTTNCHIKSFKEFYGVVG